MLGRITTLLFFLLLVWGNLVAGMKAGLACPDWPLCQGRVLPPFRLDIWMEFTHRLIAAVASLFLLVLAWKRFRSYEGAAKAVPVAAVGIVAAEIVMGGMVVLLELPVQLTTLHFMTGLSVFLLVFYMAAFDGEKSPAAFSVQGYAGLFFTAAALFFSQGALGAYVRHSGAGLACSDFPLCGGGFLPPLLAGLPLVHFSHRLVAYLILLTLVAFWVATRLDASLSAYRRHALLLLLLVLGQIGIGGMVVLTGLAYGATALHLAMALAIIMVVVRMWIAEVAKGGAP